MAVFPDRIVLKNSTDPQATIVTEIENGGVEEINQGELVLGLEDGAVKIYTKDVNDDVVIFGTGISGDSIGDLIDVDTTTNPPQNDQALVWNQTDQKWIPGASAGGGGGRGDGGDFDNGTIAVGFVFGVYGAGDFTTGNVDGLIELSDGNVDAGVIN